MYGVLFVIGNILAVRGQHSRLYGGCVAIAVGYAATPFFFLDLLLYLPVLQSLYPRCLLLSTVVCCFLQIVVVFPRNTSQFVERIKKERPTCFFYKLSALLIYVLPGGSFFILLSIRISAHLISL